MRSSVHELIVAPATAAGSGGRAIVRIAGDGLERLLAALFEPRGPDGFAITGQPPRLVAARLGPELAADWARLEIDVLHWPGPGGPTGGPLAEVQLPGSAALVDAVVAAACRHGARLARGGEFSLRSFLAGRLDLLQAEAVLAVVDARTPAELSVALDRMAGGAGRELNALRETLLDLRADIEAVIDFSDEHMPDAIPVAAVFWTEVAARLAAVETMLESIAARLAARDTGGAGRLPRVVIAGPPNIGKSSLFNALVGREAALVADEVGTTRDWIAAPVEHEGVAWLLIDVAGVAEGSPAADAIAGAAADRAGAEAARADVLVACRDAAAADGPLPAADPGGPRRIDVVTRCDRAALPGEPVVAASATGAIVFTSSRDRVGIEALRRAIAREVALLPAASTAATLRMRVGIDRARAALAAAGTGVTLARAGGGCDEALVAGHIGRAIEAVGEVTGAELGADLIDRIFARHCIGK